MLKTLTVLGSKMHLDHKQIERMAALEPILELFGSGKYSDEDDIVKYEIEPFIGKMNSYGFISVYELERTYSDCVPIFISKKSPQSGCVKGFQVVFSKLVPVVVVGKSSVHYVNGLASYTPLDLNSLESPKRLSCSVSRTIKDTLHITCYEIAEPYEMNELIPDSIQPLQAPWGRPEKPWNKLYHVAFQESC